MRKQILSLLLVVVMAFGLAVPGFATDEPGLDEGETIVAIEAPEAEAAAETVAAAEEPTATDQPELTEEADIVDPDPGSADAGEEGSEPVQTGDDSATEPSEVGDSHEEIAEEIAAEAVDEPSPEEEAVAATEPEIDLDNAQGILTDADADDGGLSEAIDMTASYSQDKVDEFINLYLTSPDAAYPFAEDDMESSVYWEATEDNYAQIISGRLAWGDLSSKEQSAVDDAISAAYIAAHEGASQSYRLTYSILSMKAGYLQMDALGEDEMVEYINGFVDRWRNFINNDQLSVSDQPGLQAGINDDASDCYEMYCELSDDALALIDGQAIEWIELVLDTMNRRMTATAAAPTGDFGVDSAVGYAFSLSSAGSDTAYYWTGVGSGVYLGSGIGVHAVGDLIYYCTNHEAAYPGNKTVQLNSCPWSGGDSQQWFQSYYNYTSYLRELFCETVVYGRNYIYNIQGYGSSDVTKQQAAECGMQRMVWGIQYLYQGCSTYDSALTKYAGISVSQYSGIANNTAYYTRDHVQMHGQKPTFASNTAAAAEGSPYELKYNSSTGKYTATLTNTNGTLNAESYYSGNARLYSWFGYEAIDADGNVIDGVTFAKSNSAGSNNTVTVNVDKSVIEEYGNAPILIRVKTPTLYINYDTTSVACYTYGGRPGYQPLMSTRDRPTTTYLSAYTAVYAPTVDLTLTKTCDSNYLDVLDGSTCYDLNGTQYGVYESYSDAYNKTNCYATVTFDSYGKVKSVSANEGTVSNTVAVMMNTTYYLRELAAGTGYTLSNTITSVAVGTSDLSKTLSDIPGNDPATITLYKTSKAGTTAKPLTGAVFSVDFYSGYYDTVEEAEASVRTDTMLKRCDVDGDGYITYADVNRISDYLGGKVSSIATGSGDIDGNGSVNSIDATYLARYVGGALDGITEHRTWYLQTVKLSDGTYRASFMATDVETGKSSLITSGTYKSDELYYGATGQVVIPYGTIVIREVKAADYYLNDPDFKDTEGNTHGEVYIFHETPNGSASVSTGNSINPEFRAYDTLQPEMVTKLTGDLGYTSQPVSNSTLKDTMSLSYLHDFVGKYVTITGSLHYQDTGEPVLDATTGRAVTASKTVYISATEQTVVQVFNFDATDCCNREVVCYEIFYYDGTEIMRHEDATDENQIVWYEKIGPGSLLVTKKTTAGSPLAGANYLLEYSNDDGTTWQPVYSYSDGPKNGYVAGGCDSAGLVDGVLTTGSDGKASFTGLLADGKVQYRLTEVGTPNGYSLMKESIYEGTLPIWADDSGGLNIAAGSGDLNGDGKVSGRDFRLLMKYVGGEQSVTIVPGSGDVNGDGQTDMKDALRLLKYVGNTDSETAFNKQFVVNFDVRNGVVDIPMTGDSGFHWWPFACSGVLVAVGMLAVTEPNRKRRKARG